MSTHKRIGLVASVESQPSVPSPAIDLYRSADFLRARQQAERTCDAWFILSPRHGLVGPNDWLEPYSETLRDVGTKQRQAWIERIVKALSRNLGGSSKATFVFYAGPEYYESGLAEALEASGGRVVVAGDDDYVSPTRSVGVTGRSTTPTVEMPSAQRRELLDEFYALLEEQADRIGGRWTLPDCSGDDYWPDHGVVFFFEDGELREDGTSSRVVRVGTHALTAKSKTKLWDRLRADRGTVGGSNPGGGNHRASAFRRHVGRALIARDGYTSAAASWGAAGNISAEMKAREMELEREVSRRLAEMSFIWLSVPKLEDRQAIEQGTVALLSNLKRQPVDPPGPDWLGSYGGEEIAAAGLWNLDHTTKSPDPGLPDLLRRHLDE